MPSVRISDIDSHHIHNGGKHPKHNRLHTRLPHPDSVTTSDNLDFPPIPPTQSRDRLFKLLFITIISIFATLLWSKLAIGADTWSGHVRQEFEIRKVISQNDALQDIDTLCKGYALKNIRRSCNGLTADLVLIGGEKGGCAVYGKDYEKLRLTVEYQDKTRLHVMVTDVENLRWQVPWSVVPRPHFSPVFTPDEGEDEGIEDIDVETGQGGDVTPECWSSYDLTFLIPTLNPFSFSIIRWSTGEILFTTAGTSLVFEPQYIRLKTWLPPQSNIYGLGEYRDEENLAIPIPESPEGQYIRTLWARDSPGLPEHENLYGSHPVYFDHRGGVRRGETHGVFMLNSNGMDVKLRQEGGNDGKSGKRKSLEYNMIGGVIDLYFLAGPGPEDVARQYARVVGAPSMIPYWSLGFHQCRYGYRDWIEVAEVVANYSRAQIPLETMWTDIDYMYNRWIFTLDPERFPIDRMRQLVKHLHSQDQRYVMMVDPAISHHTYPTFTRGREMDVFHKTSNGSLYKGVVWPGVTVFPDWLHPKVREWWSGEFEKFFGKGVEKDGEDGESGGVHVDGIWIDMNEPASFCSHPCLDPEELSRELGLPPKRLPPRDPPRPIPGFPDTYPPEKQPPYDDDLLPYLEDVSEKEKKSTKTRTHCDTSSILDQIIQYFNQQLPLNCDLKSPTSSSPLHHFPDEDLISPPYAIHNGFAHLSDKTLPTNLLHHPSPISFYDTHNLYGHLMSQHTHHALLRIRPGLRPFVITRSSFAGAGAFTGHWLGDNNSSWSHYKSSIAGMLHFTSFFQIPMVGSDVCGFTSIPTEELCARWAVLGAFSPFYRNHNEMSTPSQEFYIWPGVAQAARNAIQIRYRLLDYLYTAMHRQSVDGTPCIKPMWFIYPHEPRTFNIAHQFFYGDALLISPVLDENSTSVKGYLPPNDIWYDFATHKPVVPPRDGEIMFADFQWHQIPIHIRGGSILPLRIGEAEEDGYGPMTTTTQLRERDFEVVIAPGKDGRAVGGLYVDDGVSLVQQKGGWSDLRFQYDAKGGLRIYGTSGRKVIIRRVVLLGVEKVVGGKVVVEMKEGIERGWVIEGEGEEVDILIKLL